MKMKMKILKKRTLAWALALLMSMTMISVHTLASDANDIGKVLGAPPKPPMMMVFSGGTVTMEGERSIDDIVSMAKALPHSGFATNKATRFEVAPILTNPQTAGVLHEDDLEDALNALKMVRYLAGLPNIDNVQLTPALNNIAQHGAVTLAALNTISHSPSNDGGLVDPDFFVTGLQGCGESNLAVGFNSYMHISNAVLGLIADDGDNNLSVAGHRRWMINPGGNDFGIGHAAKPQGGYGAQYYTNLHVMSGNYTKQSDTFLAWPNAGDFPIQYFVNSANTQQKSINPWSINLGEAYLPPDKNDIELTLTRTRGEDVTTWVFDNTTETYDYALGSPSSNAKSYLSVDNDYYGMAKAIVFRPDINTLGAIDAGDVFEINITGLKDSTTMAAASLAYEIRFFDLAAEMERSTVEFVVTKHDDTPIAGATVNIDGQILTTDASGMASLRVDNDVVPYVYTVTMTGYEMASGNITANGTKVVETVKPVQALTITISDTAATYDGTAKAVTVVTVPNVAYTVAYKQEGAEVTPLNAGAYDVAVTVTESGYASVKTATLTIAKADIKVKADDIGIKMGLAELPLTYTVVSGEVFGSDVFTGELVRDAGDEIGDYLIKQGSLVLSDNYNLTFVNGVFSILEKVPQMINVTGLANKTYGDAAFALTATGDTTSGLTAFAYASSDEDVATIDASGEITIIGAGTTTISVTEPGDDDYMQTTWEAELVVDKAVLTVTANNASMTYGDTLPSLSFVYGSFVGGESQADLDAEPMVGIGTLGKVSAGTHAVVPSGGTSGNYAFDYVNGTLTVAPKDVTIVGLEAINKAHNGDTVAVVKNAGYTIVGMVPGDDVYVDVDAVTATFDTADIGDDKTVTITNITLAGADAGSYTQTTLSATSTASIKLELSAADVANAIATVPVLAKDATVIALPIVPDEFMIELTGSNNEAVIDLDGNVVYVDRDTDVDLVFTITKIADGSTADTNPLTVKVPESSKFTIGATGVMGGNVTGGGVYMIGSDVTLVATPHTDFAFKSWHDELNAVIEDAEATYTFKAESDRAIYATFVSTIPKKYVLTLTRTAGGTVSLEAGGTTGSFAVGSQVSIVARPNAGYNFVKWTTTSGGVIEAPTSAETRILMPGNSASVMAHFETDSFAGGGPGGGGPGGGGPGGSAGGDIATGTSAPLVTGVSGVVITPVVSAINGKPTQVVTEGQAKLAISNQKDDVKVITVDVPMGAEMQLEEKAIDAIVNSKSELVVKMNGISTTLSLEALQTVAKASNSSIVIHTEAVNVEELPEEQQTAAGDRPTYELYVSVNGVKIPDFKGKVTVAIPYKATVNENVNAIVVCYMDDKGTLQTIANGVYDTESKTVIFTTTKLSTYVIDYNYVVFTDVEKGYWAKPAIDFAAARKLVAGVGNNKFEPNREITRAEFVQMVQNVLKVSPKGEASPYGDVKVSAWYYPAVMAMKSNGLLSGLIQENNQFLPDQVITREEMAVILANVATYKKIVVADKAIDLKKFTDHAEMENDYLDEITLTMKLGLLNEEGIGNNIFDPKGSSTRAQAAQVQMNLVEILK